jgi:hypothetical protein
MDLSRDAPKLVSFNFSVIRCMPPRPPKPARLNLLRPILSVPIPDLHVQSHGLPAPLMTEPASLPCFEYRLYWKDATFRNGTAFDPDKGPRIKNYPEQNYANGVQKNTDTGGRFKDIVRILKRLNYKMEEDNPRTGRRNFVLRCSQFW